MKRTTTIAKYQLQPTVHIDAVPELVREREQSKEAERTPETDVDEDALDAGRTAA